LNKPGYEHLSQGEVQCLSLHTYNTGSPTWNSSNILTMESVEAFSKTRRIEKTHESTPTQNPWHRNRSTIWGKIDSNNASVSPRQFSTPIGRLFHDDPTWQWFPRPTTRRKGAQSGPTRPYLTQTHPDPVLTRYEPVASQTEPSPNRPDPSPTWPEPVLRRASSWLAVPTQPGASPGEVLQFLLRRVSSGRIPHCASRRSHFSAADSQARTGSVCACRLFGFLPPLAIVWEWSGPIRCSVALMVRISVSEAQI
jgi:hypothetical protein